jgi:phosphomannomutase
VFGTELSAHVYYRRNWYADSGAITLAVTLSLLSGQGKPMSELMKPMLKYAQSGETNFRVEDKGAALEEIRETLADDAAIDELDGVTVDAFDSAGWWFNVRPSNTEPLLRLNMEAKDRATLDRMFAQVRDMLGEPVEGH